jgi:hypothetical protein
MSDVALRELTIRNLEYVFQPPGLPLVDKGSGFGTTSILVRGGAGSGKTTLAMGISQAIATKHGGLCLYLTTEFVPNEIGYKARLLKLPEGLVASPEGRATALAGAVVVHQLGLSTDEPLETVGDRKRSAIDVAWVLVNDEVPGLAVRAMVIDAFGLSEDAGGEPLLRGELLAMIQAFEGRGISTVIVQEAVGPADWLTFVVDVVLEPSFRPDPATGELHRKLGVPKCRYGLALPGPHDAGLDFGQPAVWPDLLNVLTSPFRQSRTLELPMSRSAGVFLPLQRPNTHMVFTLGGILASYFDTSSLLTAVQRTAGVRVISVYGGPITVVVGQQTTSCPDTGGATSIGWALLRLAQTGGQNVVVFVGMESLLHQERLQGPLLHLFRALADIGLLVIVHGPVRDLAPVTRIADLAWPTAKATALPLPSRTSKDATRWLVDAAVAWPGVGPPNRIAETVLEALKRARREFEDGMPPSIFASQEHFRAALLFERMGKSAPVHGALRGGAGREVETARAWALSHLGDDWEAGRRALAELGRDDRGPDALMKLLWDGLAAVHADNDAGLDELTKRLGTRQEKLVLGLVFRALGVRARFDDVDRLATELGGRLELDPWLVRRIQAEARMEPADGAPLGEAVSALEALSNEALPKVHAAEVLHNLGEAHFRGGDLARAADCWRRALAQNPLLEVSQERLSSLGEPVEEDGEGPEQPASDPS